MNRCAREVANITSCLLLQEDKNNHYYTLVLPDLEQGIDCHKNPNIKSGIRYYSCNVFLNKHTRNIDNLRNH